MPTTNGVKDSDSALRHALSAAQGNERAQRVSASRHPQLTQSRSADDDSILHELSEERRKHEKEDTALLNGLHAMKVGKEKKKDEDELDQIKQGRREAKEKVRRKQSEERGLLHMFGMNFRTKASILPPGFSSLVSRIPFYLPNSFRELHISRGCAV